MGEIKITRINHVGIPISDRKKTLPFYRDVLGLNVIPSQVDGSTVIWTQLADGAMIHPIEPAEGNERNPASWHVALQVDDIDAAREKMVEEGYEITSEGERHDGQRFLFVNDPDGNRIEIATENNRKTNNRTSDEWGYTTAG